MCTKPVGFVHVVEALLQILKLILLLADDKDLHLEHSGYQAHFTQRMAEVEWLCLAFAQRAHHFNSFYRGVSRLNRFKSQRGADYPFQLAMIAFDNVVPVLNLPVLHLRLAFPLTFQ